MSRDVAADGAAGFNELGVKTCWDKTEELKFHSPQNDLNCILYINNNLLAVISWCFCCVSSQLKEFSQRRPNFKQKHENIRCYERTWALGWSSSSSQLRLGSITAVHAWSCEATRPRAAERASTVPTPPSLTGTFKPPESFPETHLSPWWSQSSSS